MKTHSIDLKPSRPVVPLDLEMGTSSGPGNPTITVGSSCLLRDGKPWMASMGELHYSRLDPSRWRDSLLLMRAGGIDILASYVFWIHHEEIEGQFDFTGCRDLRRFVQTCAELKYPVVMRCGPWCHGEVRNGGLPDWILTNGCTTRSTDEIFLKYTRRLYQQIATQLKGLLWKDGGPVVGIQVDNEFGGPAEYLLELKKIAREVGLDVPIYTRTGWPSTSSPMPFGQLLPLYGAYAEGFWSRSIEPMPDHHWQAFRFEILRTDVNVGADMLGTREQKDDADTQQYPYLTCEVGGGMEQSYHRRVLIDPEDVLATTLVKIGSGSTLPGYYMYHGGTNPPGKLTTLQESQATQYWNDSPVKSYDFQAPLGQFQQVRKHFHLLRRVHVFMQDFGAQMSAMDANLPAEQVTGRDDTQTLRWAVRSDGHRGFVFVSNFQRLLPMPERENVQLQIRTTDGKTHLIPHGPTTLPADSSFFLPFNWLIDYLTLQYATAQPMCQIVDGSTRTIFFAEVPGLRGEFSIAKTGDLEISSVSGLVQHLVDRVIISDVEPSRQAAVTIRTGGQTLQLVLLSETDSLDCYKLHFAGRERVIMSECVVVQDGDHLRVRNNDAGINCVLVYPPIDVIRCDNQMIAATLDGILAEFAVPMNAAMPREVSHVQTSPAGALRKIQMGYAKVAEAPSEEDFASAAVWSIILPRDVDPQSDPILRIQYVGDVARLYLDGKLLVDNFYNGQLFDIALREYLPAIAGGKLELRILPLQKDAPIYLSDRAKPAFGAADSFVSVDSVTLIDRRWGEVRGS